MALDALQHHRPPDSLNAVDRERMGAVGQVSRRLAGFTGWPMLALITPLVVSPYIARLAGDGWSSVVTAMSVGSFGMAAITWGWSLVGPPRVAQAEPSMRWSIYRESVHTRLLLSALVLPLTAIITAFLSVPQLRLESVLIAIAFSAVGLLPQWYCIGIGKPTLLGLYDTIPRVATTIISLPIMLATRSILAYPILLLVGIAFSLWLFPRRVFPERPNPPHSIRKSLHDVASMASAAGTNLIGVAYSYAPVPIATALLAATASSHFASADQLFRYALYAVTSLGNALQGWSLEVEGFAGRRRHYWAMALCALLGLAGGVTIWLAGPWASTVLFGKSVAAEPTTMVWYGIAFFFISATTPLLRNLLLPNGRARTVLAATIVSAVFGISVMLIAGKTGSSAGIAAGMALSEFLILVVTLVPAQRVLVRRYAMGKERQPR